MFLAKKEGGEEGGRCLATDSVRKGTTLRYINGEGRAPSPSLGVSMRWCSATCPHHCWQHEPRISTAISHRLRPARWMGNIKTADRLTCGYWRYWYLSNTKHWINRSFQTSPSGYGLWSWISSHRIRKKDYIYCDHFVCRQSVFFVIATWNKSVWFWGRADFF